MSEQAVMGRLPGDTLNNYSNRHPERDAEQHS